MFEITEEGSKRIDSFLSLFVCDVISGEARGCQIAKRTRKEDSLHNELDNFFDAMLVVNTRNVIYEDIVFSILNQINNIISLRGIDDIKMDELFKEIQDDIRVSFFLKRETLNEWGMRNDYWLNRSLKVINLEPANRKMIGDNGHPTLELLLNHAQNQFVYWTIAELINLLEGHYA